MAGFALTLEGETQPRLLQDLKFVLDQQELNRPEL